jgi:hypothetical protein
MPPPLKRCLRPSGVGWNRCWDTDLERSGCCLPVVPSTDVADGGMIVLAIVRIPREGVRDYLAYEDGVLPLLSEHGATLQRRLRTDDGTTEVHIVDYPSEAVLEAYMGDPRREEHRALFDASGAVMEVLRMDDFG